MARIFKNLRLQYDRAYFKTLFCLSIFITILNACSPLATKNKVTLVMNRSLLEKNSKSQVTPNQAISSRKLSDSSGADHAFPKNLCYVIHVTGPNLSKIDGSENSCMNPYGLGMIFGSFKAGEETEIEVPIGINRRFEIIGFDPGKEFITDGVASCQPVTVTETTNPSALRDFEVKFEDGTLLKNPALFAAGSSNINSGENIVTLFALPTDTAKVTPHYPHSFGEPWRRSDHGSNTDSTCVADSSFKDSDNDGLTDDLEIANNGDPFSSDSDADGLGDYYEYSIGTKLNLADSDDDGVPDAVEVAMGTIPTDRDSKPALVAWGATYGILAFHTSFVMAAIDSEGTNATSTSYKLIDFKPTLGGNSGVSDNFQVYLDY